MTVDTSGGNVLVTVHVELSEANVRAACTHLEPDLAARVLAAWQAHLTALPHERGGGVRVNGPISAR